jgi:hypothetical protein
MQELGLDKETKGKSPAGAWCISLESVDSESMDDEEYDNGHHEYVFNMPALIPPTHDWSRGKASLRPLLRSQPAAFVQIGMVFVELGEVESGSLEEDIKIWIVATVPVNDHFDCIRVKSYGGHGLQGLTKKVAPDSRNAADRKWDENEVNAHAELRVWGRPVDLPAAEPQMSKKPLIVVLENELRWDVIPELARAAFHICRTLECGDKLAFVGRLDPLSTELFKIYLQ